MLSDSLENEILKFCKAFDVVREKHIYAFFRQVKPEAITYRINSLKARNEIIETAEGFYTCLNHASGIVLSSSNLLIALDIFTMFCSADIAYYNTGEYPREITFITAENKAYDITVFDENWAVKYSIAAGQKNTIPEGELDPFIHVAYVPNKTIALKIEPLGYSLFAMPDANGNISMYEF